MPLKIPLAAGQIRWVWCFGKWEVVCVGESDDGHWLYASFIGTEVEISVTRPTFEKWGPVIQPPEDI